MRLAICTLSAVLLSGCSWLGLGSNQQNGYAAGGAYGANCGPTGQFGGQYGAQYGQGFGQAGCLPGGQGFGQHAGHGQWGGQGQFAGQQQWGGQGQGQQFAQGQQFGQGGAYGAAQAGYGQAGYGQGAGVDYGTGNGAAYTQGYATGYGQGTGAYGAGSGVGYDAAGGPVLLGQNAAYGSSVGSVAGGQFAQYASNGQVLGQNAYAYGGGAAQPFGIAAFGGQSTFNDGNLFNGEAAKPAGADGRSVSALDAISYADAFDAGTTYGGALEYDLDRANTVFLTASRTEYEGQTLTNGTITQDNTATGGAVFTDDGQYSFSDLNETAIEAGLRHYVGGNGALRPYVSGSAGFVHNNRVEITSATADPNVIAAPETQEFIREGWQPTAAGMIGAELAVGNNAALGVETGIRWTDDRATNLKSEDSFSVPVQIRGRLAF